MKYREDVFFTRIYESTCVAAALKDPTHDSLLRTRPGKAISICRPFWTCEDIFSYCRSPSWVLSIMHAVMTWTPH